MDKLILFLFILMLSACHVAPDPSVSGDGGTDTSSLGGESHGFKVEKTFQPMFNTRSPETRGRYIKFKIVNSTDILRISAFKVKYLDPAKGTIATHTMEFDPLKIQATKEQLPFEKVIDLGAEYKVTAFIITPSLNTSGLPLSFVKSVEFYTDDQFAMYGLHAHPNRPFNFWVDGADTHYIPTYNKHCMPDEFLDHRGDCSPKIVFCTDKDLPSTNHRECALSVDGQMIDCHWFTEKEQCRTKFENVDICAQYSRFSKAPASLFLLMFKDVQLESQVCAPQQQLQLPDTRK